MCRIALPLALVALALAGCAPAPLQVTQNPDARTSIVTPLSYSSVGAYFLVMPRP